MKKLLAYFSSLSLGMSLAGCMVGPDYQRPDVETPAAFKEAGTWKAAEPADEKPRGSWWEAYGDEELNALVAKVAVSNQNVLSAAAQYRQAVAVLEGARASYFPTLGTSLAGTRAQSLTAAPATTASPTANTVKFSLSASWEADLWGQIGRTVESSDASAQASAADLGAALLSAQATLVQTYFQLRTTDAQIHLLQATVAAYERSLEITKNRYEAGVAGRVDVAQAEAQLQSTRAQALDLGVQRSQYEHAIAVLIGKPPAEFRLEAKAGVPTLPSIPTAIPSALLERRPDIAGAERRTAAANAQIGVAQSAFFPALTLGASGGYQNDALSGLVALPHRFWSLGPTLALTLFDGGARSAQKNSATAAYDKAVATYRQTVLSAFQEVEDNLAALRILGEEEGVQKAATRSAEEALALTQNQYIAGTVSYLNVVTAQATALTAQRSEIDILGRRLIAHGTLLKALGGQTP
ncbi:MAG TPA: efflux transporter outer membrane subunit [Rhodocyclaceae bacterium]|jgi:NodT family efflux transporter outer membrane factor (OMF) lipoprotein|nr:efflux transporter outer membrane subunit [Rhodocyclaceae bacterium]